MHGIRSGISIALLGATAIGSQVVGAADATTNKLEELEQKVRALELKIQGADEKPGAKTQEAVVVKVGTNGFSMSSADNDFQLRLSGYVQVDGRFYLNDDQTAVNTFLLRRVRPILDVTMYKDYALRIQPDLANSPTIQDAYIEYRAMPVFSLRAGKYKVPFGLEWLQTDSEMFFAERGLPSQLVPNRDVGLQAFGNLASGTVAYAVGIFNGTVDGASTDLDVNDDKDGVARLFINPFRPTGIGQLKDLGVGMAVTFGDEQGTKTSSSLPSFKTSGQQTFFSYKSSTNANGSAFAAGRHIRLGPQANYYVGPFGIFAEYVQSSQDVSDGKNEDTIDNKSWQVQAGWVLTGEKASYTDVKPRANFAPLQGNWGALELVGQYGELTIDNAAFSAFADPSTSAKAAKTWAVGLNWYLNRNVKFMLDYDQTSFDGGAAQGADRSDEKFLVCRAQLSF